MLSQLIRLSFHSSWRRNAWRGDISRRIPSSNLSANRRTGFQPDTPASSVVSRGSKHRLLAKQRPRQSCSNSPGDSLDQNRVCLPLLDLKDKASSKPHCDTLKHKQLINANVQQ
ncbi:hypothetical protein RRG08_051331 [Elysia crispata]|uniref:Uncharacterized protein n=1 Tax=Elysia crispata TaxID=231223 RepID=A0AAE1EAN5_9GAST|nr:hypothetical protein RRG08_051331 [Elysia crispata]